MRKLSISFLLIVLSFGAIAQIKSEASIDATIVVPISIAKIKNLNFGTVAISSKILYPTNNDSSGIAIKSISSNAATFEISGENNFTYSISLPSSPIVVSDGMHLMKVSSFKLYEIPAAASNYSAQLIKIGATLVINNSATFEVESSSNPFNVIVNYN